MSNKTIKVIIFSGYGGAHATESMKEIMINQDDIKNRVGEIIKYIESTCVSWSSIGNIKEVIAVTKENPNIIVDAGDVTIENVHGKKYYIWDPRYRSLSNFSILEVDFSRPWTIDEYDGAEYVTYLDEKKLNDKELNYWK